MGVRQWVARRAVRATRVLVLECPGGFTTRVVVERAVGAREWRLAESPATADVLVVAGEPGDGLTEVVDRIWDAMPGPRSRLAVADGAAVPQALDAAVQHLLDDDAQCADAASRGAPSVVEAGDGHGGHDGMGHGDHGSMDHGGHEEMDHGGHEGMDHGDMEMAPDGIPLAGASPTDRDGLEMDELPLRLGPVLPSWPAGVVLDVTLHGDLVVDATARRIGGPDGHPSPDPVERAARWCDDVAAFLDLAGQDAAAGSARSARDAVLDGRSDDARWALVTVRREVSTSRVLRWSLAGAGGVTSQRAAELGLPDDLVGDCRDRLLALFDRAEAGADADRPGPDPVPVEALGPLVTGLDLGVARLVVASLGSGRLVAARRTGEVVDA